METDSLFPELDAWLEKLDESKLRRRVEELEAEYERLGSEINAREERRQTVQSNIERGYGALRLKDRWGPQATIIDETIEAGMPAVTSNGDTPARGREAVRALMREMPDVGEWTIQTVLRELVKRGWADPDDKHSVGVSLSRMFRKGEVYRLRHGVYTTHAELRTYS